MIECFLSCGFGEGLGVGWVNDFLFLLFLIGLLILMDKFDLGFCLCWFLIVWILCLSVVIFFWSFVIIWGLFIDCVDFIDLLFVLVMLIVVLCVVDRVLICNCFCILFLSLIIYDRNKRENINRV